MTSTALRKPVPTSTRGINAGFAADVLHRVLVILAQLARKG